MKQVKAYFFLLLLSIAGLICLLLFITVSIILLSYVFGAKYIWDFMGIYALIMQYGFLPAVIIELFIIYKIYKRIETKYKLYRLSIFSIIIIPFLILSSILFNSIYMSMRGTIEFSIDDFQEKSHVSLLSEELISYQTPSNQTYYTYLYTFEINNTTNKTYKVKVYGYLEDESGNNIFNSRALTKSLDLTIKPGKQTYRLSIPLTSYDLTQFSKKPQEIKLHFFVNGRNTQANYYFTSTLEDWWEIIPNK